MDQPYPARLTKDPIVESTFELRFRTPSGIAASDLLPGLLFSVLREDYPKVVNLDSKHVPAEIRRQDKNFRYVPVIRFEGDQFAVLIGDSAISVSCRQPYVGWEKFRERIIYITDRLREIEFITSIERFSLKYANLFEFRQDDRGINLLDLKIDSGTYDFNSAVNIALRTEIPKDGVINIIQVVSPARVAIPSTNREMEGLLLDIDSIQQYETPIPSSDFWNNLFSERLENVRSVEKDVFFSLVSKATIDRYGPKYEG